MLISIIFIRKIENTSAKSLCSPFLKLTSRSINSSAPVLGKKVHPDWTEHRLVRGAKPYIVFCLVFAS